jgi:hypothetical protein
MATITQIKEPTPLSINNFYGLAMPQAGDTQIYPGQSGNMYNCYITKDYDLSKIEGYLKQNNTDTHKIQGVWYGYVNGTKYFIYAQNGHIYKQDNVQLEDSTTWDTNRDDLGTLTDAPTQFFAFSEKLYIQNGYEYKYWDETTFGDVIGYRPKIAISCLPATGSGTPFENLNLLTGKMRKTYNGDGTSTSYYTGYTNLTSIDSVYVGGTLTTAYTTNLTDGYITFTIAPITGLDNVEIQFTYGAGDRNTVIKNTHNFLFGTAKDTRVFMYGNPTAINLRICSALANGVPSAEYFTTQYLDYIGSSSTAITGMERQQSIMLVHKENETYYSYYDSVDLDGVTSVNFPTPLINDSRGNVAKGQGQVLNNDPFTIDSQLIKWIPTTVKDERNMLDLGYNIQKDFDNIDLSKCITIDIQNKSQLWIANGKKIWIYHYNLVNPYTKKKDIFSRLYLEHEPTCFYLIENDLYFGTTTGEIMKFSDEYLTFNGTAISSHWEMNMYDFGVNYKTKSLNKSWIVLAAQPKASISVQYITDKNAYSTPFAVQYQVATFNDVDFSNFTFLTNYNPQTFNIKLKAKKFTYLKMVLDNESLTDTFAVLGITLKAEYGSDKK